MNLRLSIPPEAEARLREHAAAASEGPRGHQRRLSAAASGTFPSGWPTFEQLAVNDLDDGSLFNGSPAVVGNRLVIRSDKHLYCVGE